MAAGGATLAIRHFRTGRRQRLAPIPTGRWHGRTQPVRSDEQITGHRTLPLDLNRTALSQLETVSQALVCALGHLDRAGQRVRFHAAGGVDGVAPQVVAELRAPDHARDDRAAVDADPDLRAAVPSRRSSRQLRSHRERQLGDRLGVIFACERNPAGDHIGVTDRLDLLHPVIGDERVPTREHPVQQRHDLRRGESLGQRREAHDVREEHGGRGSHRQ